LRQFLGNPFAWRWLALSCAISIYQVYFLYAHLKDNRLKTGAGDLFPTLGLANWITITRAIFNAALAGFLFGPWPEGWLSWAPSILYLVSALMDYADGFVARITGRTTILGEILDMQWDGIGVLIASLLAVFYGQTPLLYSLVGLARYLFLFGQWFRKLRGLPLYDLPPNRIRRPFAGVQMGFLAVVLMPVYSPPATQVVAWLFMLPFLANFLRDWLVVSGLAWAPVSGQNVKASILPHFFQVVFPLIIRGLLTLLLLVLLVHLINLKPLNIGFVIITALAIPALLLGAAGRVLSLVVLLMAGFALQVAPRELLFWAVLLFSAISMMVGTGRFSLWKLEDGLLYKHAGERRSTIRAQQ